MTYDTRIAALITPMEVEELPAPVRMAMPTDRHDLSAMSQAVAQANGDAAPGLQFADWLDEHGHNLLADLYRNPHIPGSVTGEIDQHAIERMESVQSARRHGSRVKPIGDVRMSWAKLRDAMQQFGKPALADSLDTLARTGHIEGGNAAYGNPDRVFGVQLWNGSHPLHGDNVYLEGSFTSAGGNIALHHGGILSTLSPWISHGALAAGDRPDWYFHKIYSQAEENNKDLTGPTSSPISRDEIGGHWIKADHARQIMREADSFPTEEDRRKAMEHAGEPFASGADQHRAAESAPLPDERFQKETLWHGSHADFDTFDPGKIGSTDAGFYGRGYYFSPDRDHAEEYGPAKPFQVELRNPFKLPSSGSSGHDSLFDLRDKLASLKGGPAKLKTNRELPPGYRLESRERENPYYNARNPHDTPTLIRHYVAPEPHLFGTEHEIYGEESHSPLAAIVTFNDKRTLGHGVNSWWASGLLKDWTDRKKFHELLLNNGYDGIHVTDPDTQKVHEVVAFHPQQARPDRPRFSMLGFLKKAVKLARGTPTRLHREDNPLLWEAVKHDPHDSAPWLILADSLDESGKPNAAAHMRMMGKIGQDTHILEPAVGGFEPMKGKMAGATDSAVYDTDNLRKPAVHGTIGGVPFHITRRDNYASVRHNPPGRDALSSHPGVSWVPSHTADALIAEMDRHEPQRMQRGAPVRLSDDTEGLHWGLANNNMNKQAWAYLSDAFRDEGREAAADVAGHIFQHGEPFWGGEQEARTHNHLVANPMGSDPGRRDRTGAVFLSLGERIKATINRELSPHSQALGHHWTVELQHPTRNFMPLGVAHVGDQLGRRLLHESGSAYTGPVYGGVAEDSLLEHMKQQYPLHEAEPEKFSRGSDMDHAAFHAAIAAHPDDDAPRLIYSDYLEENGHPHLAEAYRRTAPRGQVPYLGNRHDRINNGFWIEHPHATVHLTPIRGSDASGPTSGNFVRVELHTPVGAGVRSLGSYETNDYEHTTDLVNELGEPHLNHLMKSYILGQPTDGITLDHDRMGNFTLTHDSGEDRYFQSDWDHPGLASAFGWTSCEHGCGTDGTIPCPHHSVAEMMDSAYEFLRNHDGLTTVDPGYFLNDRERFSRFKSRFKKAIKSVRRLSMSVDAIGMIGSSDSGAAE